MVRTVKAFFYKFINKCKSDFFNLEFSWASVSAIVLLGLVLYLGKTNLNIIH